MARAPMGSHLRGDGGFEGDGGVAFDGEEGVDGDAVGGEWG